MSIKSRNYTKSALLMCCLAIMLVSTACTTCRPGSVCETPAKKFSGDDMASSVCHGVTNILFCWVEIPHEMEARVRGNRSDEPYAVVFSVLDLPIGAAWGSVATVDRAVNGVVELLMSPVLHSSVNTPIWPAYYNTTERAERNNGSFGTVSNSKSLRSRSGLAVRSGSLDGQSEMDRQIAERY